VICHRFAEKGCSTLRRAEIYSRGQVLMPMEEFPKRDLEILWAPWRVEYFECEKPNFDFLAEAARASDDAAYFVITRRKTAFLMMNRYPYAVGHLMAVPYRKTAEMASLGDNEIVDLWNLVAHAQRLLRTVTKAQGFNIGLNLGECAGAGVPDHLHVHVVPRWSGDTNFMPILAGTRTISEGLRGLYEKLIEARTKLEREAPR
jgi:ATP adenylyltransferase